MRRPGHRAIQVAAAATVVGLGLALLVASVDRRGGRRLAVGVVGTTTTVEAGSTTSTSEAPTSTTEPGTTTTSAAPSSTTAPTTTAAPQQPRIVIAASDTTAAVLTPIPVWALDPVAPIGNLTIDFGDGSSIDAFPHFYPGFKPCRSREFNFPVTHAYRLPGTYTISASLERCAGPASNIVATSTVRIRVDPPPDGVLPSNGPRQPTIGANRDVEGRTVRLSVAAGDQDGYVRTIRIDWGDGSPPTRLERPLSECRDTPSTYPQSRYPSSAVELEQSVFEHTYAAPGTYRLSVTVESTGCDGGSVQTAEEEDPQYPQSKEVTVS